jgi:hypothetical protein
VSDKKLIKKNLNRLQRIKTWQLVMVFVLACFVAATFLRLNNIAMVQRREAVYTADTKGDETVIQSRLYDLQRYVTSHMNTDMGKGVFLVATYNRDKQALLKQAETGSNGNIYKNAQQVCAPQFSGWSPAYVQCTVNELSKYPSGTDLNNSVYLSPGPYMHTFVSPVWSPDFAGWSVAVCVVILIMILARFIGVFILKIILRYRYKNI